jgi:hypothetical protein
MPTSSKVAYGATGVFNEGGKIQAGTVSSYRLNTDVCDFYRTAWDLSIICNTG